MLIASKVEELYSPPVDDFVYISDKTYTHQEVLRMEREMLAALQWNITAPTAQPFLRRFLKVSGILESDTMFTVAEMYLQYSLHDYKMLKYLPSLLAAGAVFVAVKMSGRQWVCVFVLL